MKSHRVPTLADRLRLTIFTALLMATSSAAVAAESLPMPPQFVELVATYCLDCHNAVDAASDVDLESLSDRPQRQRQTVLEQAIRKLRAGQMPPPDATQPDREQLERALASLETVLDRHAAEHPEPGRTETLRRLTRYEYQNAIRDLLALEIDAEALLPKDEVSHGFDNITVGELSPTLVNRYLAAAQKISRLAVGTPLPDVDAKTLRIRPDVTQEQRMPGLPPGTRGGTLIRHHFPRDGTYEFRVRLARDRNEHVEGLHEPHDLEILLDSEPVKTFQVRPPQRRGAAGEYDMATHANVDRHLKVRVPVTAGPHEVAVTFVKKSASLLETKRQPLNVHYNMYRHPRLGPAVYQVTVTGPFDSTGVAETPSRRRIFICRPDSEDQEERCAETIFEHLMRYAFRGQMEPTDLAKPMAMFREGREQGGFEDGIEWGLGAILVHPKFLFRIERDPEDVPAGKAYPISDLELASRLSFFLWSSLPDEPLLRAAEQGELRQPEVLRDQVLRMLRDERSAALVHNFAGQWLYLRNLESITPDARLYPDFGDNLRQAFRRETELFFQNVIDEDRSVVDLLDAKETFLNGRLAKHYGIPNVHGTRFRRVALPADSGRGGLLRHGSILAVTSYATRTSPVIRGTWILENILGTPPPPPPPNVPALEDNTVAANLPVRERLAAHRANAACASCHNLIDPVGFCLERYDAVGRLRGFDQGVPIDTRGGLPDGQQLDGVDELIDGLTRRPELFVRTLTEKLLTYGLGRGCEPTDGPAIRKIVRDAAEREFRFSALILGIVNSPAFQMRTAQ